MNAPVAKYPVKILTALHAIMQSCGYVQKKGRNDFQKYNYAGEANLLEVLRPAMVEHGLLLIPSGKHVTPIDEFGNVVVEMEYTIAHKDGDVWPEKITAFGAGNDKNSKGGVGDKGVYKAVTGANKYLLFKLFQIETGNDPEEVSEQDKDGSKPTDRVKEPSTLKTASWTIKATGAADFVTKFTAKMDKAPTLDAVAKLTADNKAHIESLSDEEYKPVRNAIEKRTGFLGQAPAQEAAE